MAENLPVICDGGMDSPREDSEADEERLTLKARSESLSSGELLWEMEGELRGGLA